MKFVLRTSEVRLSQVKFCLAAKLCLGFIYTPHPSLRDTFPPRGKARMWGHFVTPSPSGEGFIAEGIFTLYLVRGRRGEGLCCQSQKIPTDFFRRRETVKYNGAPRAYIHTASVSVIEPAYAKYAVVSEE